MSSSTLIFLGLLPLMCSSLASDQTQIGANCSSSGTRCTQYLSVLFRNRRQNADTGSSSCVVPEQPRFGKFTTLGQSSAPNPGSLVEEFTVLKYSCEPAYQLSSASISICEKSQWDQTPACQEMCHGQISTTLDLVCKSGLNGRVIPCSRPMPFQSTITAACKPGYSYATRIRPLTCTESGNWDFSLPACNQVCGEVSSTFAAVPLIVKGQNTTPEKFPWHVGLYITLGDDLKWTQICAGSIISSNVIITAAHCAWAESSAVPADTFRVATGKYFRDFYDQSESQKAHVQILKVTRIFIPERYGGDLQNQQEDVALLLLDGHITFSEHVKPICLDVKNKLLYEDQVMPGVYGKVAGWGLTSSSGVSSPILQTSSLPVIDYSSCKEYMPVTFWKYLTSDKFCAGYTNGTSLCQGDSGGGLVFSSVDDGVLRWYIRGVVSVAPTDSSTGSCNENSYTAFTSIFALRSWLDRVLEDISFTEYLRVSLKNFVLTLSKESKLSDEDLGSSEFCIAPAPPYFGSYVIVGNWNKPTPGTELPEGTTLLYRCLPGYRSPGNTIVVCKAARWWFQIPVCQSA